MGKADRLVAVRRDFNQLDFSTVTSFIDSLYSITGDFQIWKESLIEDFLTEYSSDDNTAIIVVHEESIICCRFYRMSSSLLGKHLGKLYKCKTINGGVVFER